MIRRRTITSYVWNSVSGNKMVILSNCIRNFFRKFELIGNSVQGENPAPDNPQEIKSAGRKSKNLFNIADLRVGQVQKDGTINEKQIYYRTVILDVPQDGKYRITFNSNDDYTMLYFTEAYANGAYSNPYIRVHAGSPNYYITLAKGKNILSFSTHTASERIVFTTDHNIMIAAESETLDYEPYGYFFDVKITGKNLIPDTVGFEVGSFNYNTGENMSLPDRGRLKEYIPIAPGKKYLVTVNGNTSIDDIGVHFLDINRFPVAGYGSARFISPLNAYYVRIRYKGWTENDKVSLRLQDTSLDYEPYTEQTVQIALNEPLRGIGDYKDTITKDGVVRKILEAPIAEYLQNAIYGNPGEKYISSSVPKCYINYDKNKCMSNIGFASNAENKKYIPIPRLESFLIKVSDDDTVETIKEKNERCDCSIHNERTSNRTSPGICTTAITSPAQRERYNACVRGFGGSRSRNKYRI